MRVFVGLQSVASDLIQVCVVRVDVLPFLTQVCKGQRA